MGQLLTCLILLLSVCGCARPTSPPIAQLHHEDGRVKPIVAFLPVINSIQEQFSWSLGEEFTYGLRYHLLSQGNLYLSPMDHTTQISRQTDRVTLFSADLDFAKRFYPGHDFVAIVELLEHREEKTDPEKVNIFTAPAKVIVKARVRVIDLHFGKPKVILQEIIEKRYPIKSNELYIDYTKLRWENEKFPKTPWGIVHNRLEKELAQRIEDYILLTRG